VSDWAEPVRSPVALDFADDGVEVTGWLANLRRNAAGALLSLEVRASKLGRKPDDRKWHHLMKPWVAHRLASARGLPLHTAVLGTDCSLYLAQPRQPDALKAAHDLLESWRRNPTQPLPRAPKPANTYLLNQAYDKGRTAYERGYQSGGERD